MIAFMLLLLLIAVVLVGAVIWVVYQIIGLVPTAICVALAIILTFLED